MFKKIMMSSLIGITAITSASADSIWVTHRNHTGQKVYKDSFERCDGGTCTIPTVLFEDDWANAILEGRKNDPEPTFAMQYSMAGCGLFLAAWKMRWEEEYNYIYVPINEVSYCHITERYVDTIRGNFTYDIDMSFK